MDAGTGIAPSERERVFEAFYRGDVHGRPGSGLGLAIARAIVLAHGGRIRVEGSPAGGASVVFELPSVEPQGLTSLPRGGVSGLSRAVIDPAFQLG